MALKDYRGFRFEEISAGRWRVILPSKISTIIEAADEDEVKARIDAIPLQE